MIITTNSSTIEIKISSNAAVLTEEEEKATIEKEAEEPAEDK